MNCVAILDLISLECLVVLEYSTGVDQALTFGGGVGILRARELLLEL
jgi:hypothetical protein